MLSGNKSGSFVVILYATFCDPNNKKCAPPAQNVCAYLEKDYGSVRLVGLCELSIQAPFQYTSPFVCVCVCWKIVDFRPTVLIEYIHFSNLYGQHITSLSAVYYSTVWQYINYSFHFYYVFLLINIYCDRRYVLEH